MNPNEMWEEKTTGSETRERTTCILVVEGYLVISSYDLPRRKGSHESVGFEMHLFRRSSTHDRSFTSVSLFLSSRPDRRFEKDSSFVRSWERCRSAPDPILVSLRSQAHRLPTKVSMRRIESFGKDPIPSRFSRMVSLFLSMGTGPRSGFETESHPKGIPFGSIRWGGSFR